MNASQPLKDKLAVVTGGSRGIGRYIAEALLAGGAEVVITARGQGPLEETARALGGRCHAHACDHGSPEAIETMAAAVRERHGDPDILVNNAAVMHAGPVTDFPLAHWNAMIATNLTGVFLVTRAFLPAMIEADRGDIFMISSMSGKKGDPGSAAYNASKFGLQGFSQALMYEARRHNIRVMVLNPSRIDTGDDPGPHYGPGLYLHAADVAATILHLAALPGRTMIRDMDIFGTNPP